MFIGKLAASVSDAIYGTAVAGFGFSLGKDVYRNVKESRGLLFMILALAGSIILPVIASSQLARWYSISTLRWVFSKLLLWGLVSIVGFFLIMAMVALGLTNNPTEIMVFSFPIWALLTAIGLVDGLKRRKVRKEAYTLEKYNQNFLDEQGVFEVDGAESYTHMSVSGERLRLVSVGRDVVEFFVVGGRNKRAYITLNDSGQFTSYSGVVSI